jgi:hypothetical protein
MIYDWTRSVTERRDFWLPPWTPKLSSLFTYMSFNTRNVELCGSVYDSVSATKSSALVRCDFDTIAFSINDSTLTNVAWTTGSISFSARIQTFKNPPGNHVNTHGIPQLTTVLGYVKIDYYAIVSDNIGLNVFYDNSALTGGTAATSRQGPPSRRPASQGYITREWEFYQSGQDFALQIVPGDIDGGAYLRLDRLAVGMLPGAGPDAPQSKEDAG